jgi:hypothetical protein
MKTTHQRLGESTCIGRSALQSNKKKKLLVRLLEVALNDNGKLLKNCLGINMGKRPIGVTPLKIAKGIAV